MEEIEVVQVQSFDGLVIWQEKGIPLYEIGNFLGSGAAGTVYEAESVKSRKQYAIKILNPIGYKMLSTHQLRSCTVVVKGKTFPENLEKQKGTLDKDYIWWLINNTTKQFHAAYFSERQRGLKELSLQQCISIWTASPEAFREDGNEVVEIRTGIDGTNKVIPMFPSRFSEFLRKRIRIFREIHNMRKVSDHPNVIRLEQVLDLTQDSKCTIFLVMELANGGELFDRIKIDFGTREETARTYFKQLLSGVRHCHERGVCHRDLKPENLLLSDSKGEGTILKVADFGFSADIIEGGYDMESSQSYQASWSPDDDHAKAFNSHFYREQAAYTPGGTIINLKSIVGSPFYVAPEVMQATEGYNGFKADIWSLGVILYAMLAGSLPFGQDHSQCKRFRDFSIWMRNHSLKDPNFHKNIEKQIHLDFPSWLFPVHFTLSVRGLIVSMLHPDPAERISVQEAQSHPWCWDPQDISEKRSSSSRMSSTCELLASDGGPMTGSFSPPFTHQTLHHADEEEVMFGVLQKTNEKFKGNESDTAAASIIDDSFQMFAMDGLGLDSSRNNSGVIEEPNVENSHDTHKESQTLSSDIVVASDPSITNNSNNSGNNSRRTSQSNPVIGIAGGVSSSSSSSLSSLNAPNPPMRIPSRHGSIGLLTRSSSHSSSLGKSAVPSQAPPQVTVPAVAVPLPRTRSLRGGSSQDLFNSGVAAGFTGTSSGLLPQDRSSETGGGRYSQGSMSGHSLPTAELSYESDLLDNSDSDDEDVGLPLNDHRMVPNSNPPSFSDHVKRSTRFFTTVSAAEVLDKVEHVLEDCIDNKIPTPIGIISRIEVLRTTHRINIWSVDMDGTTSPSMTMSASHPFLCALQLYEVTGASSEALRTTPRHPNSQKGTSFGEYKGNEILNCDYKQDINNQVQTEYKNLYLVEFVRGQLDIFTFKKFYRWIRTRVVQLVKRDYAFQLLDM